MPRGRKPLPPAERIGPDFVTKTPPDIAAEQAAVFALDRAVLGQTAVLMSAGRMQTYQFMQKLSRVGLVKEFEKIRESKEYKDLPYLDKDQKVRRVGDLHEFCEIFLGCSYQRIAEDCQNLNTLGDELYEHALALGLTTRNFRDIRGLQQNDQELVKEAIATKSREAVIEVMESLVVKHAKETKKKDKQLADLQSDLDAARQITAKKDEKINDLHTQIHRRETLPDLDLTEKQLQELAFEAKQIVGGIARFSARLREVFERDEPPQVLIDHACNMLTFVAQEILAVQSEFTLPIKLEEEMDPHYITKLLIKENKVVEG